MGNKDKGVIDLISLKELANKLGVKESWIYQRTRANEIPVVRVGKYLKFNEEEVMEWLKKQNEGESVSGAASHSR